MSQAREAILGRLRQSLEQRSPFAPTGANQEHRLAVTQGIGDRRSWSERFCHELEQLGGTWEYIDTVAAARLRLLARFQAERVQRVLVWDPDLLPVPGLQAALATIGIEVIVPDFRNGDRTSILRQAAEVDLGITGVEAALAATATLVMRSGPGLTRLASLITPHHLALVPVSRLYPNLESWLAELRDRGEAAEFFAGASNVTFISGPSRTSDIEMTPIVGMHGPRQVEVLLFAD